MNRYPRDPERDPLRTILTASCISGMDVNRFTSISASRSSGGWAIPSFAFSSLNLPVVRAPVASGVSGDFPCDQHMYHFRWVDPFRCTPWGAPLTRDATIERSISDLVTMVYL